MKQFYYISCFIEYILSFKFHITATFYFLFCIIFSTIYLSDKPKYPYVIDKGVIEYKYRDTDNTYNFVINDLKVPVNPQTYNKFSINQSYTEQVIDYKGKSYTVNKCLPYFQFLTTLFLIISLCSGLFRDDCEDR